MLIAADRSTLILIDYQLRLMPAIHQATTVLENAGRLASCARRLAIPVAMTRQVPEKLGPTMTTLEGAGDEIFDKVHFDASAETDFQDFITRQCAGQRGQFIVAGCETHVCVLQTVLSLRAGGHSVGLVADACGSRRPRDTRLALARAGAAGAQLLSTEMVLFEWLRRSDHPDFKAMLQSIT